MEVGTLAGTNDLAIPSRASDISTERIFRLDRRHVSDRRKASEAAPMLLPAVPLAATVSRPMLVGLCLTTFAFGILLTWTAVRGRPIPAARLLTPPIAEKAPQQTPPLPLPLPVVEPIDPIVVAAAPPVFDWPPLHRAASQPTRPARTHAVRATVRQRPAPADEAESPSPTSVARAPAPPAAKWVDPFAQ
jgi:hypothetical protein